MENNPPEIFGTDRGWNDPPPMPGQGANAFSSSGVKLNKRIGFPTSGTMQNSNVTNESMTLCDAGAKVFTGSMPPLPPPPSLSTIIPPPPNPVEKVEGKTQIEPVEEVKFEDVAKILEANLCEAENSGALDEKKASDIRKRIGILQEKWTNDKLNEKVHLGMLKLAKFMESGQMDEAEKIQRNLNVEHPSLCTPWMIAIRQLILAQKSENKDKN